jgi:ATP-dependent protease ClpP protease subunit
MTAPSDSQVVLFLRGQINERSAGAFLRKLELVAGRPVQIYVDSRGGCVYSGLHLFRALSHHAGHTTVIVKDAAHSMAATVIQAADEVLMVPGAQLLIHDPSDQNGRVNQETANLLAQSLALRSGRDPAQVREWMSAETVFTAAQAVALGLADGLLVGSEVVRPSEVVRLPLPRAEYLAAG